MKILKNLHLHFNVMKQVSQSLDGLPRGGGRTVYVEDSKYCTVIFLFDGVEGGPPLQDDLRAEQGDSIVVEIDPYGGVSVVFIYGEGGQGQMRKKKGLGIG